MHDPARFLRQIHPSWEEQGVVAKIAFLPSAKDCDQLSGDDALLVTAEEAHTRFIANPGRLSMGVFGLSDGECVSTVSEVVSSPTDDNPSHVHLEFSRLPSRGQKERAAKRLRELAVARGILYCPEQSA